MTELKYGQTMKLVGFNNRAPRNGRDLSDKGREAMATNEVNRKFGDGLRFGYTTKGLPVEYVPNHHACLHFGEARSDGQRSHHHSAGFKWVPADTTSPAYIDALDTIPTCKHCRAVRWHQDQPCRTCAVMADPAFPSYEDDDRDELTGDEK